MKSISKKAKIAIACSAAACLSMGSTLAVFMDTKAVAPTTVAVGTVTADDVLMDIDPYEPGNGLEENFVNTSTPGVKKQIWNVNPGDENPMDITLNNAGTKSTLTRTYLYVLLDPADPNTALKNYHLLIEDHDGVYKENTIVRADDGTVFRYIVGYDNFVDISKGTLVRINAGTPSEKIRVFPMECGRLDGQPAVRYTLGVILDGVKNPDGSAVETEPNSSGSNQHVYNLKFHANSDMHYTDPKTYEMKSFTAAVQYRNSSDAELEKLMAESEAAHGGSWSSDSSWKK